jgi:cytochrome bd-type quinol oxidase subunit 2
LPETSAPTAAKTLRTGPGRLLVAVYGVFALAATARGSYQLATRFDEAPAAYALSLFAGVVYLVAAVGLARAGRTSRRVALVSCAVEMAGVLVVGTASVFRPSVFPEDTVWSGFGSGYLFIPLVLPALGLWWILRVHRMDRD